MNRTEVHRNEECLVHTVVGAKAGEVGHWPLSILIKVVARLWKSMIAPYTPSPMPSANCRSSGMLCARKTNIDPSFGSACHHPPYAPGQPTDPTPPPHTADNAFSGSSTTATPMPNPCPAAKIDLPSILDSARWRPLNRFDVIIAKVSGFNRRMPSTAPPPTNIRANAV